MITERDERQVTGAVSSSVTVPVALVAVLVEQCRPLHRGLRPCGVGGGAGLPWRPTLLTVRRHVCYGYRQQAPRPVPDAGPVVPGPTAPSPPGAVTGALLPDVTLPLPKEPRYGGPQPSGPGSASTGLVPPSRPSAPVQVGVFP